MQALTLLAVLSLSHLALAQSKAPTTAYTYSTPASTPNQAENCISDICGPPARSNLYMTQYQDRLKEYVRKISSDPKQVDFPSAIAKQIQDLRAENQKQSDIVLALFRKSKSLGEAQLDGISRALYNVLYASPFLQKVKYTIAIVNGKSFATVDEAATSKELASLSPEDRNWIIQVAKVFATESSSSNGVSERDMQSQPADLLLKELHPGLSLKEAMKEELIQAQGAAASLKDLSPLEKALFFNKTSRDRIAFIATHVADGTVDENETREIIQWNLDFRNNNDIFRNPSSPIMSRNTPSVEEIINANGGADAVAKSFEQDRIADAKKDDEQIQSCKLYYFLNMRSLPTKQQVANLNQDIIRSKQNVEEMIKSKFPTNMQQKLIKAVEDADFVTPPSASDFDNSFLKSIKQKVEAQRANVSALVKISPGEIRKLLGSFTASKASQSASDTKDDSNEFCDAFKYSPMSDGNYTTYGSIMLSFTTATGDEASRLKTIMHELGHSVSKAIADDPHYSCCCFFVFPGKIA